MAQSPPTLDAVLAALPADRRAAFEAVRAVILQNLDKDYEEGVQYGTIAWYVPHRVFPAGYHCDPRQPLPFACLDSKKGHMSLHMMGLYFSPEDAAWFRAAWTKAGKKLDMGAGCVRFKKLDDVPLEVVGEAFRRIPASAHIARYEAALRARGQGGAAKSGAAKPATAKPAASKPASRKATAKAKPAPKTKKKTTRKKAAARPITSRR